MKEDNELVSLYFLFEPIKNTKQPQPTFIVTCFEWRVKLINSILIVRKPQIHTNMKMAISLNFSL